MPCAGESTERNTATVGNYDRGLQAALLKGWELNRLSGSAPNGKHNTEQKRADESWSSEKVDKRLNIFLDACHESTTDVQVTFVEVSAMCKIICAR